MSTETYDQRVKREHAERYARIRGALTPLGSCADALGAKLGGTWRTKLSDNPSQHCTNEHVIEVEVRNLHGTAAFDVRYIEASKRLIVSTKLPQGVEWRHVKFNIGGHTVTRPEATFDPARGVAGLTASLKRILADAETFIADAVAAEKRERAHIAATDASLARLAKAIGRTPEPRSGPTSDARLYGHPRSIGSLDARVYQDSVTLSLSSVPIDLAEKILKLVAAAPAAKED